MKHCLSYIIILATSLMLLSCVNEAGKDMLKGPAMRFSTTEAPTKSFIENINRSGNEVVVYDYMTGTEGILDVAPGSRWYIDHARLHCTVDGQQVWDYVSGDEYFWLYGSNHNCFGWLFSGPAGNNTITFFGEHPEFEKDNFTLPLPAYKFTYASPIYDFLYSDVTKRTYTQANPDSSPISLKMHHFFSAYRFNARSVREAPLTINSAVLKVVTQKKATIDFGHAIVKPAGGEPLITYTDIVSDTLQLKDRNHELSNGSATINLFDRKDVEAFRMIWPQDKAEFADAVLEIGFTETVEGQLKHQTKIFRLNGSQQKEWAAGNRYSYDIVFTDKEILLMSTVMPWDRKEIVLDFTDVVVVSDKIQWNDNTISHLDEHTGEVVLSNTKVAECYFKIDAPQGAKWHASFVPIQGHAGAFTFVDPDTNEDINEPSGDLGKIGRIKIRVTDGTNLTNTNKAKLRIIVTTSNDEQSIVVENLCSGHDYNEYTLVQNMI